MNELLALKKKYKLLENENELQEIKYQQLENDQNEIKKALYNSSVLIEKYELKIKELEEITTLSSKIPTKTIKELEKDLTLNTKTLKFLIEYLIIDNYEIVKNITTGLNSQNAKDMILYLQGALWRNQWLISSLEWYLNMQKDERLKMTRKNKEL